jgi:hypothetical protein
MVQTSECSIDTIRLLDIDTNFDFPSWREMQRCVLDWSVELMDGGLNFRDDMNSVV